MGVLARNPLASDNSALSDGVQLLAYFLAERLQMQVAVGLRRISQNLLVAQVRQAYWLPQPDSFLKVNRAGLVGTLVILIKIVL